MPSLKQTLEAESQVKSDLYQCLDVWHVVPRKRGLLSTTNTHIEIYDEHKMLNTDKSPLEVIFFQDVIFSLHKEQEFCM